MKTRTKNWWLISLAVAMAWVTAACSQEATQQEVSQTETPPQQIENAPKVEKIIMAHLDISVSEFQAKMNEKAGIILDVRTPEEVAEGVIEGAVVIDYYGDQFKDEIAKLDKNQTVYVYCRSGGRSGKTMSQLKDLGFANVYNLTGGITAWKAAGLPLVQIASAQ